MSKRRAGNWLKAFVEFGSYGEAPLKFLFWVGASTLAGAMRRRVWIDQQYFHWTANMYVILVAPPGVVSKSTTASIGMNLLKDIQDIKFGPDVVTWQKLVEDMGKAGEQILDPRTGQHLPMSCLTLSSGEAGNLIKPEDREMIDVLVSLWDGQKGTFKKGTKSSGSDSIENPWINIIACTTPSWISGAFPDYMIGGGFTSRCVFVYTENKRQFIAYPADHVPETFLKQREDLVHDLEHISTLVGEMELSREAKELGEIWYNNHWKSTHNNLTEQMYQGFLARKQTHIHKLAMIISVAESDELIITREHLLHAADMVDALEEDMRYVFNKIGRTIQTQSLNDLVEILAVRPSIPQQHLYQIMSRKCTWREFTEILDSAINAGFAKMENRSGTLMVLRGIPLHA